MAKKTLDRLCMEGWSGYGASIGPAMILGKGLSGDPTPVSWEKGKKKK